MYRSLQEAQAAWRADAPRLEQLGVFLPDVQAYVADGFGADFAMAMDAIVGTMPQLTTAAPSSAVPALLTTMIDPAVFEILFTPNKAADIFGEVRKGSWLDETIMFPTVEHVGEVSSYGDFAESCGARANTTFPQRQSYLFQTIKEYGERELERAGLAKINWVTELDKSAAAHINKFLNLTYFFGVLGLQNYGLLNDPALSAALTPATKAAGGTAWISGGVIKATANEVYSDLESIFLQLVNQSNGLIEADTPMTLGLSPASQVALTATNTFNVNVHDLLKKNFPKITIETAMQYGVLSASNPQGNSAGNIVQLIARKVEEQDTGYCAFNEKMRAHPIIRAMSSFKQKVTAGTWGAVIRQPFAIASMVGV